MRSDGYRRTRRVRPRCRQLVSVLQVLVLAVATLVLVPVVVEADQDDPFSFQAPGDRAFRCAFTGDGVLIDTTTTCQMDVSNGATSDASMFLFVGSIRVMRCLGLGEPDGDLGEHGECAGRVEVPRTDPDFERFVGAWAISVRTAGAEPVVLCEPRGLSAYDGGLSGDDDARMCPLGVVKGLRSSAEAPATRSYEVGMTLRDDGTDQTRFNGWDLHFDLVVRARL